MSARRPPVDPAWRLLRQGVALADADVAAGDLFHTARLHDIALRNDATLPALSGHDWLAAAVTPVPEPSTWGLIAAGLCVVARIAKRRSHRVDR